MKIVILDGYTENPGDLSWEEMEKLGELTVYDRTPVSDQMEIIRRIGDAEIVITNKTPVSRAAMDACPNIKYIGMLATGYNVVDYEAAKEKGIPLCNIPSYGTEAVGQFAIALLLEICHHIGYHDKAVHDGRWENNPELESDTCRYADLDEVLGSSDVIALHCPLFADTEGIINKNTIAKMKDGVIILNNSRGPLIVEQDLADALASGKVYAAGLDVVSSEPIKGDNPLLNAPNCIITPHISWAPKESRKQLMDIAVDNVKAFLNGTLQNVVNL